MINKIYKFIDIVLRELRLKPPIVNVYQVQRLTPEVAVYKRGLSQDLKKQRI